MMVFTSKTTTKLTALATLSMCIFACNIIYFPRTTRLSQTVAASTRVPFHPARVPDGGPANNTESQGTNQEKAPPNVQVKQVNNVVVYIASTFSTGGVGDKPLIETRGQLILKWAPQMGRVSLVTDYPVDENTLEVFSKRHDCRGSDTSTGSDSPSSTNQVLRCSNWRVILTPCSALKWGSTGPCCKFDAAAADYFSQQKLPSVAVSTKVEWFVYSDDDLFLRPFVLQAFLALFDSSRAVVFGATDAGPRFRDLRKQSRVARGACRRETSGCEHTMLSSWQQLRLSASGTCREPPVSSVKQRTMKTTTTYTTTETQGRNDSAMRIDGVGVDKNITATRNSITASKEKMLRSAGMAGLMLAGSQGEGEDEWGIEGGWRACENEFAAMKCEACIAKTVSAVAGCMGPYQAYFPGNLQPLIASAAALQRMEPALSPGNTLRSICEEWSVTHDGALVFLFWMLRVGYLEAAKVCGAYVFAKKASNGSCVGNAPAALIDRVKIADDLVPCQRQPSSVEATTESNVKGFRVEPSEPIPSWVATWGGCLAAGNFEAAREIDLSSVEHTQWWRRTANGTKFVSLFHHPSVQKGSILAPATAKRVKYEEHGKTDIFSVEDCRAHTPCGVPPGGPRVVPERGPRGRVALKANIRRLLEPWVDVVPASVSRRPR